jgi:D-glucuronyl C5-epimerase C-terminus
MAPAGAAVLEASIVRARWAHALGLALALGLSLVLGIPSVGGLSPVRAYANGPASTRGPSVSAALEALRNSGAISEALYRQDDAAYLAAKRSLGKLTGTRRTELGAVLSNLQAIAAAGAFAASRLPALFLTLEQNRRWWSTEPLLANGERLSFPPSKLVWEYYAGQGIEIQWLATFGEANGYYLSGENADLRQLLGEVIPLATKRAGGIAWEYMFRFDGGSPPWTSGLSQGTALQALARAWSRLKEPADLAAAQQALGIFETPPPAGVRVSTPAGALYAEYTFAPNDRILNGFIQALVGLYDYTSITKDPLGLQLFEAGDAEARADVPLYNTGAWSMYDQFGESSLNYHELLIEFLQHLCERTRAGPPLATPSSPGPIAGDAIYCTTAQQFTADLSTPPVVSLLSTTLPTSARAGVALSLSKVSKVSLTVRRGGKVVWSNRATVEHGKPKLLWVTPATAGAYSVALTATDLAGNSAAATGTITLVKAAKAH